jgi:hypothetical protein
VQWSVAALELSLAKDSEKECDQWAMEMVGRLATAMVGLWVVVWAKEWAPQLEVEWEIE